MNKEINQEQYEKLVEVIQGANPDILKPQPGCYVKFIGETVEILPEWLRDADTNPCVAKIVWYQPEIPDYSCDHPGDEGKVWIDDVYGPLKIEDAEYEVLGREITINDVMIALCRLEGLNGFNFSIDREGYLHKHTLGHGWFVIGKGWDHNKSSLALQSDIVKEKWIQLLIKEGVTN